MEGFEVEEVFWRTMVRGSIERLHIGRSEKIQDILKELLFNGLKAILSLITAFLLETINLIFIGQHGDHTNLSGVGLGSSLISMLCITVGIGMLGATDTLVS
jgi:Na+-driven multidrug efflux pump